MKIFFVLFCMKYHAISYILIIIYIFTVSKNYLLNINFILQNYILVKLYFLNKHFFWDEAWRMDPIFIEWEKKRYNNNGGIKIF